MSTLLIDIGNSRIKWFFDAPATPLQIHTEPAALAHHTDDWLNTLRQRWHGASTTQCRISNVAHTAVLDAVTTLVAQLWPQATIDIIVPQAHTRRLQLAYDAKQMGSDRYAQLCGAQIICPQRDHLVISAGTATTIDGVLASGQHIGGIILPSVHLMRQSLHQYTAKLPLNGGVVQNQAAPHNTADALASAAHLATIGAIREFTTRYMSGLKPDWVLCGGNAAALLDEHTQQYVVPALCLWGLK